MKNILEKIPWAFLLPVAVIMALAPFTPEPHLVEKIKMLFSGQLKKPVDVFDLLMHSGPLFLIACKVLATKATPKEKS